MPDVKPRMHVLFTKKRDLFSWTIRFVLPRSRFAMALASHSMIVDEDHVIEATFWHGVRRVPRYVALRGSILVAERAYEVPDAQAGISWARGLAAAKAKYDRLGALGLGLAPGRRWQDPADWFCFEVIAGAAAKAGRIMFDDFAHVTGTMLMAVPEEM